MYNLYYLALLLLLASGCTVPARIVYFNRPSIEDTRLFCADTVCRSAHPFQFSESEFSYKSLPPLSDWVKHPSVQLHSNLEDWMLATETTSFLVIRNDSILYENYFNGYDTKRPAIIFSVSKAITTALVGIAIHEGKLRTNQKVAEFIPEFANDGRRDITIEHLLQMTSGLDANDYGSLWKIGRLYYNNDLRNFIPKIPLRDKPGTVFCYKSLDTAILGVCLEQAIGKPIAQYLEEKLWQPIGTEYNCLLTLDRPRGQARMYGGLAACARDLAKVGRLYLNNGNWNGTQVLPEKWIARSTMVNTNSHEGCWWGYSTGWWLDSYVGGNLLDKQDFQALGYSGQMIYVNPESNVIIVRQGKSNQSINWATAAARLSHLLNVCSPATDEYALVDTAQFVGTYRSRYLPNYVCKIERKPASKKTNAQVEETWQFMSNRTLGAFSVMRESPLSLFNDKQNKRIIFQTDKNGQIEGLYFDNFRKTIYFDKVDPSTVEEMFVDAP